MGCGGGCGCAPCGGRAGVSAGLAARALAGDPAALKLLAARPSQLGGFLPDVVWASDVDAYKAKLDPNFRATDTAVKACTGLAPGILAAWLAEFAAWREFADTPQTFWGASNGWELAHRFEKDLLDWQTKLEASGCALHSPKVHPPDRDAPDLSWVKYVAVAAAVLGVAYVASPLVLAAGRKAR